MGLKKKALAWLCYCIHVIVARGGTILGSYHVSTEKGWERVFIEKTQLSAQKKWFNLVGYRTRTYYLYIELVLLFPDQCVPFCAKEKDSTF